MLKNSMRFFCLMVVFCFFGGLTFAEDNGGEVLQSEQEQEQKQEQDEQQEEVYEAVKIKDVKDINRANVVVLQALNKITAKSYRYEVKVGGSINFERLIVSPLFCWKSSPADIPENKVLLKIVENKLDKTQGQIFYGWMFSSSPSISSLEHSMYDITVVDCKKVEEEVEN